MDFVQISNFFLSGFFMEILSEHIVFDIVERKEWFYVEKIEVLKGPKNRHFPNGLVHGFCPKIEISRMGVFYRNYVRKKNRFFNILDRKQTL